MSKDKDREKRKHEFEEDEEQKDIKILMKRSIMQAPDQMSEKSQIIKSPAAQSKGKMNPNLLQNPWNREIIWHNLDAMMVFNGYQMVVHAEKPGKTEQLLPDHKDILGYYYKHAEAPLKPPVYFLMCSKAGGPTIDSLHAFKSPDLMIVADVFTPKAFERMQKQEFQYQNQKVEVSYMESARLMTNILKHVHNSNATFHCREQTDQEKQALGEIIGGHFGGLSKIFHEHDHTMHYLHFAGPKPGQVLSFEVGDLSTGRATLHRLVVKKAAL